MKLTTIRAIALACMVSVGCGYILYPERRGNEGTIDGGTLVMDLLWLIPGVVPGVVFLIVDFTSGAIYIDGRVAMSTTAAGNLALHLRDQPAPHRLELRVVTKSNRVLADQVALVGPTVHDKTVELALAEPLTAQHEPVYLQVLDEGHLAQAPVPVR